MRTQVGTRCANKSVSMIHQIEHWGNDEGTRDYADHECNLLLPRRRINKLPGFEILQIIVCDRGDVENNRGSKKRERHQSLACIRRNVGFTPRTSNKAAPITTRI